MPRFTWSSRRSTLATVMLLLTVAAALAAQQPPTRFGGAYSELQPRRQQLVDNWVARFTKLTKQSLAPGPFYDEILPLSTKTTFDAVTHALLTTSLTDASGASLGDALALVEYVEGVRGEVRGASGDRQFRIYVRLKDSALGTLKASREFKRGPDNAVFHKGYPISYRQQGGVPSIQVSVAVDGRRADVDVDYRSSSFPASMFNGHLSSANSDVRAGSNLERHDKRWAGLQNWWRSFFGIRIDRPEEAPESPSALSLPNVPRAGNKNIDVMVHDFLTAWLVEGDVMAAMGYVSPRASACVALQSDDPAAADLGMAPYQLLMNLKAAHDAVGPRASLDGLLVGMRLPAPELRVVRQPHHAQYVIVSVPDDVAARFDCESRLSLAETKQVPRAYGTYFGTTFYVAGRQNTPVALLWAREGGYWKVVSWQAGTDDDATRTSDPAPAVNVVHVPVNPGFQQAVRGFLDSWLVRKDYDAAFRYLSPKSYACYDLVRGADEPAASSLEDAGRRLRLNLERAAQQIKGKRALDSIIEAAEPVHPAVRIMDHRDSAIYSLSSVPDALADVAECDARAQGAEVADGLPLEYGRAFGATVRFRMRDGAAPVLRTLWRQEDGAWRITAYGVESP